MFSPVSTTPWAFVVFHNILVLKGHSLLFFSFLTFTSRTDNTSSSVGNSQMDDFDPNKVCMFFCFGNHLGSSRQFLSQLSCQTQNSCKGMFPPLGRDIQKQRIDKTNSCKALIAPYRIEGSNVRLVRGERHNDHSIKVEETSRSMRHSKSN